MSYIILYAAPVVGVIALIVAFFLAKWVGSVDPGTERMQEIAGFIHEGSMAFLKREYKTMVIVVLVLSVILAIFINPTTAILYVIGSAFSVLAYSLPYSISL